MIYAYTVGKTRLTNILWNLQNVDKRYIVYPNNIEYYLKMILHEKPASILGMGIYSGRDKDKIRIETICTNKFKRGFLDIDEKVELTIPNFLTEDDKFKLAKGMGNSYCNFSAYKITKFIKGNKLDTKFSFLHVPKRCKKEEILTSIYNKLYDFTEK